MRAAPGALSALSRGVGVCVCVLASKVAVAASRGAGAWPWRRGARSRRPCTSCGSPSARRQRAPRGSGEGARAGSTARLGEVRPGAARWATRCVPSQGAARSLSFPRGAAPQPGAASARRCLGCLRCGSARGTMRLVAWHGATRGAQARHAARRPCERSVPTPGSARAPHRSWPLRPSAQLAHSEAVPAPTGYVRDP